MSTSERVVLLWAGNAQLLLDSVTYGKQGELTGGMVVNGAWELSIENG